MSQVNLINHISSKLFHRDQYSTLVESLPDSVGSSVFTSECRQLILPPITSDTCITTSPRREPSNILQRLTNRRIEKHKNRLEKWYEKLSQISKEVEDQVITSCENTASLLDASWERQKSLFDTNLSNEQLLELEISDLESLWNQINNEYVQRRSAINNLERDLFLHENTRATKIREEFHELTDYLTKYSYLSPNELQTTLEEEIFAVDIELLENYRELAGLTRNLHLAELINHRYTTLAWSNYRQNWQKTIIKDALQNFEFSIKDEKFQRPSEVKIEIYNLSKKYEEFVSANANLINEFCENIIPSNITREFFENWNNKAKQLFTEWDEANQQCLNSVYAAYENNSQKCIDEIQQMKDKLFNRQLITSPSEIENLIKVNCIPFLGRLQSQFESNLNYLDQCFIWSAYIWPNGLIQPLLKYGQMFDKLWSLYSQEPINNARKDFANNLNSIKQTIFEEIRKKDKLINVCIDALRQSSSEQVVNERLDEALSLFNEVKLLYQSLNEKQIRIIDAYIKQVTSIIDLCEMAVHRYFGIMRCSKQQTLSLEKRLKQKSPVNSQLTVGYDQFLCISQPTSPEHTLSDDNDKATTDAPDTPKAYHIFYSIKHHDIAVEDLSKSLQLNTKSSDSQVGEFFKYLSHNPQWSGIITGNEMISHALNEVPIKIQSKRENTESQRSHDGNNDVKSIILNGCETLLVNNYVTDFIRPVKVKVCLDIIKDVKSVVRVKVLEYLEQWKSEVALATREETILRRSETDNEYLMQIKLHESRIRRVKEDVANVRQAELALHQTRIERHITAVSLILNEMKLNATKALIETLNKSEEQMADEIQKSTDKTISKATKSSTLLSLRKQVESHAAAHSERVREALKSFRQELNNQVQTVNNSNLKLIESLKLFTDGGNFATVEAKKYAFSLNELSKSVKQFEEEILGNIESIEKERQLTTENRLKQFGSVLKPHMADVIYLENMIRCVTNAEAQIKSQIEDSSSQMKVLSSQIEDFANLLKSITETNHILSKTLCNNTTLLEGGNFKQQLNANEKIMLKEMINKAVGLLTAICVNAADRCIFLNCLRSQMTKSDGEGEKRQTSPSKGKEASSSDTEVKIKIKVVTNTQNTNNLSTSEHTKGTENQTALTDVNYLNAMQTSRPGRLLTEDPCTQVVQSIFNERAPPGDKVKNTEQKLSNQPTDHTSKGNENKSRQEEIGSQNKLSEDIPNSNSMRMNTPTKGHRTKRDNNNSNNPPSTATGTAQKTSRRKKNALHQTPSKTSVKHNRPQLYYEAFGKDPVSSSNSVEIGDSYMKQANIEQATFIGRIQRICRDSLHNALHLSENYYKQKGLRQPTRPDFIKSTFDDAASHLVKNLKTYFEQAETYRSTCIKEFSEQLNKIEYLASQLPNLLFEDMTNELKCHILNEFIACENSVRSEMNELKELQTKYNAELHPEICSPGKESQLILLIKKENERRINFIKLIHRIKNMKSQIIHKGRQLFSQRLSKLTDYLFIRFDSLIGSDEIDYLDETTNLNTQSDVKKPCKIMINNMSDSVSNSLNPIKKKLDTKEDNNRGKRTWEGIKFSELLETSKLPALSTSSSSTATRTIGNKTKMSAAKSNTLSRSVLSDKNVITSRNQKGVAGNSSDPQRNEQQDYCLVSAKTTQAHMSTLKSRDIAVEEHRSSSYVLWSTSGNVNIGELVLEQSSRSTWSL
uniref:DUF4456 domain-containing protein n=1 Tax=Trichobilharzia regenti TaxID=157069 RepID=A0AA85J993_TRIRE|nr:unnamed protein product [Trichobilharzia regenti]